MSIATPSLRLDVFGLFEPVDAGVLEKYGALFADLRQSLAGVLNDLNASIESANRNSELSPSGKASAVRRAGEAAIEALQREGKRRNMLVRDLEAARRAAAMPTPSGRATVLRISPEQYFMRQREIRDRFASLDISAATAALAMASCVLDGIDIILSVADDPMSSCRPNEINEAVEQARTNWLRCQYPTEMEAVAAVEAAVSHFDGQLQTATKYVGGKTAATPHKSDELIDPSRVPV